jgi:hypothetical protein
MVEVGRRWESEVVGPLGIDEQYDVLCPFVMMKEVL